MAGQQGFLGWWRGRPAMHRFLIGALLLAVCLVLVAGIAASLDPPAEEPGITTEQYQRWRAECVAFATETLDTRVFRVGGNTWIDKVNDCLLAKATD